MEPEAAFWWSELSAGVLPVLELPNPEVAVLHMLHALVMLRVIGKLASRLVVDSELDIHVVHLGTMGTGPARRPPALRGDGR